ESRDTHVLLELEQRNDRLDCYARTARFNICARRQFGDRSMTDADRRLVDAVIGVIREREERLPVVTRSEAPKVAVREVVVDRLLMPEGRSRYYINPY